MKFPRPLALILVLWLAAAIALGAAGIIASLIPPWPQVILAGLTAALIAAYTWSTVFRGFIQSVPTPTLIAFHLVRFVGLYFLWLYGQGRLPFAFAVPGGWGDFATATAALLLLIIGPRSPRTLLTWNLFGFIDILFVVANAARLAMANPGSMAELLRLPLSLLPTFIVPLIIFTHIVIFLRLKKVKKANVIRKPMRGQDE
jgi:hypothetical protein